MRYITLLLLFPLISFSADKFDEVSSSEAVSKVMNENISYFKMVAVQKRTVDRFWLSEFYLGGLHTIFGYPYSYSGAVNGGYQLHINPKFSLGFGYSYNFHKINGEGKNMIQNLHRIPFLLKYAQKQSYQFQGYWYPIYGKYVLGNRVFHSDLYLKAGYVNQGLHNLKNVHGVSFGFGMVNWWNQRINSRLEIETQYYEYKVLDKDQMVLLTSFLFSLGLLL